MINQIPIELHTKTLITRQFGKGPQVSQFTLGTMRAINSADQMCEVLEAAISIGINHIETAPAYGSAEKFLGESLQRLNQRGLEPSNGWVVTSKMLPGQGFKEGQEKIQGIITRLGLKRIDNLAIHGLNLDEHLNWAINGEGSRLLNWALKEGLVGQLGFSSHGSSKLIKETLATKQFNFCSLHLHLFDQERIPIAQEALAEGIGVMAISPADKGGKLQNPSPTLIKDCAPISPLELAYRFLLSKGISTLTIGAYKPEDLDVAQKLASCDEPITNSEKTVLNNLNFQENARLGRTKCGQCRECLPCPQAVPIPELLRLRNLYFGHDLKIFTKERYNLIGRAGHWWESINADACIRCGDCLPKCPNNLDIPNLLKETHQLLADKPKKRLWS